MAELPDLLWPKLPYKTGDRRPPMMRYGFILWTPTLEAFFKRYSHADVKAVVKELGLDDAVPEYSYVEHMASEVVGGTLYMHPVYAGGGASFNMICLWSNYNEKKDRALSEEEEKLCEIFGTRPMWYLDGKFPTWDVKE